jgi:hypothetical protein
MIYSKFGGKSGLFISSIESLCRESNEPLPRIDYTGLNFAESLKKLSFQILKLITAKRSVEFHRLAIGEALNCPKSARHGYTHGPARTASFIRAVLESHRDELGNTTVAIERMAVILYDSLTGDSLYRLLAGVGKQPTESELTRLACAAVGVVLGCLRRPEKV